MILTSAHSHTGPDVGMRTMAAVSCASRSSVSPTVGHLTTPRLEGGGEASMGEAKGIYPQYLGVGRAPSWFPVRGRGRECLAGLVPWFCVRSCL